jgi:hypothetical protein
MRVAIGLIGVLVTIGIIVWIMNKSELPAVQNAANVNKNVRPKVEQMAGKDSATGEDARTTIKLADESKNGKMTGVLVTDVTAGGAMEKYFGLKRGDVIVEIAPSGGVMMPVADMSTAAEAKDQLLSALQNFQQVVVMRDEKKITIPATPGMPPTLPGKPAPAAGGSGDPLQKQLDGIKVPR